MKIAISTESSADLSSALKKMFNIHTIPLTITLGEESFFDSEDAGKKIFEYVEKTKQLPKTSAVNEYQFKEYFEDLLQSCDEVIHLSMGAETSCTCANAKLAAKGLKNVTVIDTKNLCGGMTLLCITAAKLRDKGLTSAEIIAAIEEKIPHVRLNFVPKKLDYLRYGGRCSALQYLGANLLKIRPTITMLDGKVGVGKKYIGNMSSCFSKMCQDVLEKANPDFDMAVIAYTTIDKNQLDFAQTLLKERGFEEIYPIVANGTISCHVGEYAMGIMFIEKSKK